VNFNAIYRELLSIEPDETAQAIFDMLPMGCIVWSDSLELIACNEAMVSCFGLSSRAELVNNFEDLMPARQPCGTISAVRLRKDVEAARETGVGRVEWMLRTAIGSDVCLEVLLKLVGQGERSVIVGVARDITDTKPEMKSAIESGETYKYLLDNVPYAMSIWDKDTNILDCNMEYIRMFGLSKRSDYFRNYGDFVAEFQPCGRLSEEMRRKYFERAVNEGSVTFDWTFKTKDGESVPTEVVLVRLGSGGDCLISAYIRDMRRIRKAHQTISTMREEIMRVQMMFDAAPMVITFFDSSFNIIDCNQMAVSMFGMKSKTEYSKNFFRLMSERQPDGRLSLDVLSEMREKATKNGSSQSEFVHMNLHGELLPTDMTLVRIRYRDGHMFVGYSRNISEIKALISREQEAGERAQLLVENAPIGIDLWDEELNVIDCNQELLTRLGVSSKQEYIDNFHALTPDFQPDGRRSSEHAMELFAKVMKKGFARADFVQRSMDGTLIPVKTRFVRVKYGGRTVVAGYSIDMREHNEMKLRENEAEWRAHELFNAAPIGISYIDENNNMLDCNQAMLDMLGVDDKEEYIKRLTETSPKFQPDGEPSDSKALAIINQAFKGGILQFEWVNLSSNGEIIPTNKFVACIRRGGKPLLVVYTVDMREIKNLMEREREAGERTQLMYDAAPFAVSFWGDHMMIVDCNQEAVKLFGMESKEQYIEMYSRLSPETQPDGRPSAELESEYVYEGLSEGFVRYEWMYQKLDGTLLPCEVTMVRVMYRGSYIVIGYARDLREVKVLIEREQEANERNRLLLDATPLVASFWDKEGNIVDCNKQALTLFDLSAKEEYLERFDELSPDMQPDGVLSGYKMAEYVSQAFDTGFVRFEWVHQKPDKTPIPCEVTLVLISTQRNEFFVASYCRDLRELKQSLERERESSDRVRLLFDATPLAANLWNESYKVVDCNRETLNMFEVSSKDDYRNNFHNLSPKTQPCGTLSKALSEFYVEKTFKEGYAKFEWIHQKLDGTPIPCEVTLVRLRHRDSYIVAGYARDLREIRDAMQREREANDRAQLLIEYVPMGIEMWDEELNLIDCNIAAVRMVGAENKEEYIQNYFKFSPTFQPCGTPSRKKSDESVRKALQDGEYQLEWTFQHVNGELVPCDVIVTRAKYRNKDHVVCYARDLREFKNMLARMREADERSGLMLDATPLACYLVSQDFKAIDCNMEVLNLFELHNKQEGIERFAELFPERQEDGVSSIKRMKEYLTVALTEGYYRFEFTQQKLDGDPIPCNITLVRLRYRDDYVVASYIQDMREFKRMIQEMKRIEVAEENSQAKTKFLARMSHEIRTPMNAILGISDIQLYNENISPELEEAFAKIHNSASLLLRIINDILDLSKIEAGKMELILDGYETASLVNDTVQLNVMRLEGKPVEFKLVVDQNLPSVLYGDELRIKQILNNLLSNAIKYTHEGKVELSFYAVPGPMENMVYLGVTVSDTGQGMTREQLDLMYSEYSRFNEHSNKTIEGTGLGMSIVSNLVRMMDAQIYVDSEVGTGSMFTVLIPQETVSEDVIGPELAHNLQVFEVSRIGDQKRARIEREPMPYGRVLVVDDTETNLYVAEGLLVPYGLKVETVSSGIEAVARVEAGETYDVIFMDHMMPIMDGIEATSIIRKMGYSGAIVALTANAVIGQADIFYRNGFSGFVSKPIDIHQLDAALMRFIRDKQPPDVIEASRREKSKIMRSDNGLTSKLIESFLRDAKKSLEVLNDIYAKRSSLVENEDAMRMFTINTHSMKSALANIRKNELSQFAGKLEQAGRDKDLEVIAEETPRFLKILRQIVEELTPDDNSAEADEDPALLKEHMAIIRDTCEAFDKKGARKALNELGEKRWSSATKELIGKITEHLLHSEFEEAAEIAKAAAE